MLFLQSAVSTAVKPRYPLYSIGRTLHCIWDDAVGSRFHISSHKSTNRHLLEGKEIIFNRLVHRGIYSSKLKLESQPHLHLCSSVVIQCELVVDRTLLLAMVTRGDER